MTQSLDELTAGSEKDVSYKKGYAEGFLVASDTFQEMLKRLAKDVERLEWILNKERCGLGSREDIDNEMMK